MAIDEERLSLSVFFPAYNDGASISKLVERTFQIIPQLTSDYEVIVVNDGSRDNTGSILAGLAISYAPHLRVITHESNRGYGAALRSGFAACTKDAIFYTDGDGQYDVGELENLWKKLRPGVDLVNGYKLNRADGWVRRLIGNMYNWFVRRLFVISIRDVDCDFRLVRRSALNGIQLCSDSGSICVELVKKIQNRSGRFEEVGVVHYPRTYGRSQFFRLRSIIATAHQLIVLYAALSADRAYGEQPVE